jgi:putative Holliday junction resolvase
LLLSRIVGIDYGTKRSGIAATDILQIAVHGVDTVPTGTLWDWLEAYIKKEEVEKIVIGHPTHADGNAVSFMNQIIGLERKIKKTYPHIVVVLHDEAFSSVRAKQVILASGVGQKKRKDKSLVDKVAAILILQDYLRY